MRMVAWMAGAEQPSCGSRKPYAAKAMGENSHEFEQGAKFAAEKSQNASAVAGAWTAGILKDFTNLIDWVHANYNWKEFLVCKKCVPAR
jgi:hypothetical protein